MALVLAFLSAENENRQLEDLPMADFSRVSLKILHDTFYISYRRINLMKSKKLKAKYVSSLWFNDTDNCYLFRGFLKMSFESPSRETLIRCW